MVEVQVPPEETALVPVEEPKERQSIAGVAAVAALDDDSFARNLEALRKGQDRVRQIQEALMRPGVDYGVVPGTGRPTLMKPGAEKLTLAYGMVARIEVDLFEGDGYGRPALRYDAKCIMHVGTWDGPIVAVGYGTSNSWEPKYRWRKGGKLCPDCGKPGVIMTKRHVWWHPDDAKPEGGCGNNFQAEDPRLVGQIDTRIENPDPWDNANTLMKMAEKRAHVDAVLRATATSGLFTQDLEDRPAPRGGGQAPPAANDWSLAAFRFRTGGMQAETIAATAKELFPEATSLAALTDDQRSQLYGALIAELEAMDDIAEGGGTGFGY